MLHWLAAVHTDHQAAPRPCCACDGPATPRSAAGCTQRKQQRMPPKQRQEDTTLLLLSDNDVALVFFASELPAPTDAASAHHLPPLCLQASICWGGLQSTPSQPPPGSRPCSHARARSFRCPGRSPPPWKPPRPHTQPPCRAARPRLARTAPAGRGCPRGRALHSRRVQ